jgi:hypothetical protein
MKKQIYKWIFFKLMGWKIGNYRLGYKKMRDDVMSAGMIFT